MSEQYAPDEPASFDAIVERQPYEPATESADPFVGKDALSDAADEVSRGRETKEMLRRFVRDPDDPASPAPRDVTISAETAADSLRANRNLEAQYEQSELNRATAAAVDDLREQPTQPPAPELGQVQPQPELQPQPEAAPAEPSELDVLLAPLPPEQRPHFVAAFNQMVESTRHQAALEYQQAVQQAQGAAQQYQQGIMQAGAAAIAGAMAAFPELSGINDMAQLNGAVQMLQRSNPQRYAQLQAHIGQVQATINAAQQQVAQQQIIAQQQQRQQAEVQKQQFRQYAEYHDSRVAAVPPEVGHEVVAIAAEHGISKQQLLDLYETNPVMRHSAFQSMMADAAKYRLVQRATHRAQVRPVPRVQRPGASSPEARDHGEVSSAQNQFNLNPSAKAGAALLAARRGSR
jgi:hypothetical protein